jgi:hypothetical protein
LICLIGCVPSINPLYTENVIVFDSSLLGDWENQEELWTFKKKNDLEYEILHTYRGELIRLQAHLVKLEEHHFLNLKLNDSISINYLKQTLLSPVNGFVKINLNGTHIELSMLEPEQMIKAINRREVQIKHVKSAEGRILLTANSKELQSFFLAHLELFKKPLRFNKIDSQ